MKRTSSFSLVFFASALTALSTLVACGPEESNQGDGDSSLGVGGTTMSSGGGWGTGSGGSSAAASGGSTSASGGSPGTGTIPPTFETVRQVIITTQPTCVASDCHAGGHDHSAIPLRLIPDEQLYTELTTHISENCGNIPVVNPGDPENSALIKLLKGPCGETARMPDGCFEDEWENNCVPDEYIAAIEQWIADGALEN